MPKHKKTLKQKFLADKRREAQYTSLYSLSKEFLKQESQTQLIPVKHKVAIATTSYAYLADDLRKTAIFTGFIVLFELMLKIFLK